MGLQLCLDGLSPQNPPRGDGSASLPLLRPPLMCMLCQQTSPKRWFANVNIISHFDVKNSVYPVTMTTIRHCSILEFSRGASNQAVAPGITRPLHATVAHEFYFKSGSIASGICHRSLIVCCSISAFLLVREGLAVTNRLFEVLPSKASPKCWNVRAFSENSLF